MFRMLRPGDHVKARADITRGVMDALCGAPTVRRGQRGIVREVGPGWWRTRCSVEFSQGWSTRTIHDVVASDLTRTFGHGEEGWARRRDVSRGIRLGLLAMNIPILVSVGLYLLKGGDPVTLAVEIIVAGIEMVTAMLLSHPLIGIALIAGAVGLHRLRSV